MPELAVVLIKKSDGTSKVELKSALDADGIDTDLLNDAFGDNWEVVNFTAKVTKNGDELDWQQECYVFLRGQEPYFNALLEPQKRFAAMVTSIKRIKPPATDPYKVEAPTEEMYRSFEPPLLGRIVDRWLQTLNHPNILQDPDFSAALKRKLDALEAAKRSASGNSTPDSSPT
jgi:hypothetical protein